GSDVCSSDLKLLQLFAGGVDQCQRLLPVLQSRQGTLKTLRCPLLLQPEPKPLQLHGGGKTFVKGGIAVDIENAVGQLVEHQGDHAVIRQGGKAGMQWIIEPAQGGIGGNGADKGIVTALLEGCLFLSGIGQTELAAIDLAACTRIPPLPGGNP